MRAIKRAFAAIGILSMTFPFLVGSNKALKNQKVAIVRVASTLVTEWM